MNSLFFCRSNARVTTIAWSWHRSDEMQPRLGMDATLILEGYGVPCHHAYPPPPLFIFLKTPKHDIVMEERLER